MHDVLVIESGSVTAGIRPRGGRLEWLRDDGVDLVVPASGPGPEPGYHGAVIAPWPNRLEDGAWTWQGRSLHVPVNEVARNNALHGFTPWMTWDVVRHQGRALELRLDMPPRPGWPCHLALELDASVDGDGLTMTLRVHNVGTASAPWGTTIHPYLRAPAGPQGSWTVQVPATQVLEVDATRLLPTRVVAVHGTDRDLRAPVRVAGLELDHAFTGLVAAGTAAIDGAANDTPVVRAEVRDAAGDGVHITWSPRQCPWVQVFTGDGGGVAIEPMTCPPNALRTGTDLVVLEPSATHASTWTMGRLTG